MARDVGFGQQGGLRNGESRFKIDRALNANRSASNGSRGSGTSGTLQEDNIMAGFQRNESASFKSNSQSHSGRSLFGHSLSFGASSSEGGGLQRDSTNSAAQVHAAEDSLRRRLALLHGSQLLGSVRGNVAPTEAYLDAAALLRLLEFGIALQAALTSGDLAFSKCAIPSFHYMCAPICSHTVVRKKCRFAVWGCLAVVMRAPSNFR